MAQEEEPLHRDACLDKARAWKLFLVQVGLPGKELSFSQEGTGQDDRTLLGLIISVSPSQDSSLLSLST